jgi:hypothetical protein
MVADTVSLATDRDFIVVIMGWLRKRRTGLIILLSPVQKFERIHYLITILSLAKLLILQLLYERT